MVKKTKKTVVSEQVSKTVQLTAEKKEDAQEPEPEVSGVISLGTSRGTEVGRNKSGMPWKKSSKRSEFSKGPPIAYLKSMEEKARIKRIQERV